MALGDALGTLVPFVLPGQRHDSVGVAPLIDGITFAALLGDKGFDNDPAARRTQAAQVQAVIPPKANRKIAIACDFAKH